MSKAMSETTPVSWKAFDANDRATWPPNGRYPTTLRDGTVTVGEIQNGAWLTGAIGNEVIAFGPPLKPFTPPEKAKCRRCGRALEKIDEMFNGGTVCLCTSQCADRLAARLAPLERVYEAAKKWQDAFTSEQRISSVNEFGKAIDAAAEAGGTNG